MRCDRSRKRNLLVRWGLRRLARGANPAEVRAAISRMMRRGMKEVEEFVRRP